MGTAMRCNGTSLLLGFALLVPTTLAGCASGPSVGPCVPVEGKVTLGGKALVGGRVTLVPFEGDTSGPHPEGVIDAQGHYTLNTAGQEGAPLGKYRALVAVSGEDRPQSAVFNPLYGNWRKSPLVVHVTENARPGAYDLPLTPLVRP
jgi:hypothetical protein